MFKRKWTQRINDVNLWTHSLNHHALRRFLNTSVHHRPPQWCTAFAFDATAWSSPTFSAGKIACKLISYSPCQNCTQFKSMDLWYQTPKIWQNQHGSIHKTNLIWAGFQHHFTEDVTPTKPDLPRSQFFTRPSVTRMPLVMGPFL